ncbi:hypothetical protein PAT3040_03543 [Paenibacillus agaridevorans]|uniref:S-layer protein n=1 Tax=Paenibacillus agaridevorans TaxID=171404 RepID=A0A2R5EV60_9BACL|nr:S-layer homology domain-containing protein [Paenibacillus agaridevorans]GBG08928.1 hypothetical protein PAT3040_03543 [Paenibacillus agaridevorans]
MNVVKKLRKVFTGCMAFVMLAGMAITDAAVVSAASSAVDVLDPDFINSHGGKSISIYADSNKSPYEAFGEAFGTDNPVEGATKTARSSPRWGNEVAKHVENMYDEKLGKDVFKVEVNGNDCFTCYLHNTSYDSATDTFTGGNDDRQRIEIRPGEDSDLIGLENDITAYNWKLKLDKNLSRPDGFFHIFQYKAVNASGQVSGFDTDQLHDSVNYPNFGSDEDGNPILTLTVSSSATQRLEFRYASIGSEAGQETLASIPVNDIKDRWVEVTVKILNSEYGWVTMTMKDVETGEILMEYNDPDRILDIWRRPELKYNGQTFEGPYPSVYNMLNRPKWGIYRRADKSNDNVQDAIIYLADMTLYKSAVGVSSVNLAYGKQAYNTGAASGNAYQLANAVPKRLTDGVQADPVEYAGMTIPQDNSALGHLNWVGTEGGKKGNVILDLGQKMDFNQVKLFASERIKNVDVWVSDDANEYPESELSQVVFTKVDDLYTDDKGDGRSYYNAASGASNIKNKEFLIDLGKTYSSRYVKFFFENGGGNNTTNGTESYSMSGPPRVSELEIYNAPQTPKNVTIDYANGSEATISWDNVPADYFVIYDEGKPLVDAVASNVYQLVDLDPGALYNLSVRTVYTDPYSFKPMLSAESEVIQLQTDGDPIIPDAPASVTATAASDKSIVVNWESVPDAQSYRVALATDAYERIVADEYKGTSYTIQDLSPGQSYTAKVYSIRRGTPSAVAAEDQVTTSGIKHGSDNLLFNKEVRYTRVWNDDTSSYGAQKALDNDAAGSRWVALKGSTSAWMMVDIGEITAVSTLEYYSFQNKLKRSSFYYATDGEAFTNPDSDKWIKILTDDRVEQGKFGDPTINAIAESIALDTPVHARFIKFTIDEVDGDINVNEVKAFGPMSFTEGSALTAARTTATTVELSWANANTTLPVANYEVYNGEAKITTVTSDLDAFTATGLTPNTEYTFRVRALSEAVADSVYSTLGGLALKVTTLPNTQEPTDPGPSNPGPSNPGPSDPDSDSQDGEVVTVITQETASDGKRITRVTVDRDSLKAAAAGKEVLELILDAEGRHFIVDLPGDALHDAASLTAVKMEIAGISYELPLSVLGQFERDDIVSVYIGFVSGRQLEAFNRAVADIQAESLLPSPIEFRLFVAGEEITDFEGIYVERKVRLDQPVSPDQTTAVWMDANNELHFVPAIVNRVKGNSEIVIRSPHNSMYTVIGNEQSFDDLKGHWAQEDVELLANKLIVKGQSESIYNPEKAVTRAEFAALLVRSLGLLEQPASSFVDVPSDAWFAGAVGSAEKYGLIRGFEDGTFKPGNRITREEMAVMVTRALKAGGRELQPLLDRPVAFVDSDEIGDWSRQSVNQLVSANLLHGKPDGSFAPRQDTTRAEAAAIAKRILQHLRFIN